MKKKNVLVISAREFMPVQDWGKYQIHLEELLTAQEKNIVPFLCHINYNSIKTFLKQLKELPKMVIFDECGEEHIALVNRWLASQNTDSHIVFCSVNNETEPHNLPWVHPMERIGLASLFLTTVK